MKHRLMIVTLILTLSAVSPGFGGGVPPNPDKKPVWGVTVKNEAGRTVIRGHATETVEIDRYAERYRKEYPGVFFEVAAAQLRTGGSIAFAITGTRTDPGHPPKTADLVLLDTRGRRAKDAQGRWLIYPGEEPRASSPSYSTPSYSSGSSGSSAGKDVHVKGHYRTLKSGKTVYVKPHTRSSPD